MKELSEVSKVVRLTLIRMGIKCDLVGYTYLATATELVIKEPMLVYDLKKLFKQVAEICGVANPFRVEANIQNAITFTYNSRGFDSINVLYGMEVFKADHKPTTAEVIKLVAEYYELGLYKNAM